MKAGTKLKPGEDPGPVAYASADTQRAMEQMLSERAGSNAAARLREPVRETHGQAARPRQSGARLDRRAGASDVEFYEALFERLVEVQPLSDDAPKALAEKRAQAIVDAVLKAGLGANRVQAAGIRQVTMSSGSGVSADLALEPMPGGS